MKIVTVIGARPQFIKASSLSREIARHSKIEEVIVHTGQHFDENMSSIFFDQMQIPKPKYNLDIHGVSHGAMTGRMLEEIEKVLILEKPDWLVVYGDTNSTLAGALAAQKLHIKVAHVEAGLRSFDMKMPEEVNRILTDQISALLFCPSTTAMNNLKNEGFVDKPSEMIYVGDIMYDSTLFYRNKKLKPAGVSFQRDFILGTIHRQENTDDLKKLTQIIQSFNELSEKGIEIVVPIHPRTARLIKEYRLDCRFTSIAPVGYLEMIYLLDHCKMVITDSGGLQKEASFFKKKCAILRDTTEWVELIQEGSNELIVVDSELTERLLKLYQSEEEPSLEQPYGNGTTSERVIKELLRFEKN